MSYPLVVPPWAMQTKLFGKQNSLLASVIASTHRMHGQANSVFIVVKSSVAIYSELEGSNTC